MISLLLPAALAAGWPTESHDSRRTAQSDVAGPATPDRVGAYSLHEGMAINMPTVVAEDGTLYVGTWGVLRSGGNEDRRDWDKYDGRVEALGADLAPRWTFQPDPLPYCYDHLDRDAPLMCPQGGEASRLNGTVEGTPTLTDDGRLIFGRGDGKLYALDAASGALIWRFSSYNPLDVEDPDGGGQILAGTLVDAAGTTYFLTSGTGPYETQALYAVDAQGELLWRYPGEGAGLHNSFAAAPALSPDGTTLYVAGYVGPSMADADWDSPGWLAAFDIAREAGTGEARLLWEVAPEDAEGGPLQAGDLAVGHDGALYVGGVLGGTKGAALMAFDPQGSPLWEHAVSVDGDRARVVQGVALREVDGETVRVYASSGNNSSSRGGTLIAVEPATGELLWTFDPEDHESQGSLHELAIDVDGVVYLASRGPSNGGGTVFAVDEQGELVWKRCVEDHLDWGHPVIGPEGNLSFGENVRPTCALTKPVEDDSCEEGQLDPLLYVIYADTEASTQSAAPEEDCSTDGCGGCGGHGRRGLPWVVLLLPLLLLGVRREPRARSGQYRVKGTLIS